MERVDQLMALCDELEARQARRREERQRLGAALTDGLLAARDPAELAAAWTRLRDAFDLIYDTPETVPALRQAILQLAVQGRLVEQDPNDEPAEALLKRIRAEKLRLARQGLLKRNDLLPSISGQMYFKPSGWEWERLGEIADIVSGVTKGRVLVGRRVASYPYLRVANVQRGYLDLEVLKEIEIPVEEIQRYRLLKNDILLTEGGDWDKLGRTAIWRG